MDTINIVIFDEEDLTRTLIESYLSQAPFHSMLECFENFSTNAFEDNSLPVIAVININSSDTDVFNKISEFSCRKNIKFIAASYDSSADLQIKAFRAGVKDFLAKPLIKDNFLKSMQEIYTKYFSSSKSSKNAFIFSAVPSERGCGKSSFLINTAKETADISQEKVLFIDLNRRHDNISYRLDIDNQRCCDYYINNLTEENAQALCAGISRYKNSNLFILSDSYAKQNSYKLNEDKVISAVNIFKKYFKYIVIDSDFDETAVKNETLINISDEIFCIILPFISSFDKIKNVLDNYYQNKNIKIILNKYSQEYNSKIEKIQSELGFGIFWKIPQNYSAANIAAAKNITFKEAAPDSDIENAYKNLAEYLVNKD